MKATDVVKTALGASERMLQSFLSDLSDADLLVRPVPGANHTAWQLGHLIGGEVRILSENLPGVRYPELPAGFSRSASENTAATESGFCSKQQYLDLFQKVREATLAAVSKLSDADLDRPATGPLASFAPTLGDLLLLASNHSMMHVGQFTVVRRLLKKPYLM